MGASRLLLVARVIRLGLRAPRDRSIRWERYWAGVGATGDGGDVLWDASGPDEAARYLDLLAEHANSDLPVVDLGCGNGRFTRALATRFGRVVGVDLAASAVERARRESPGVDFRAADMTTPGVGSRLRAEFGACHVFVRGVLHVLTPDARVALAANVADLVGTEGIVLIAETNFRGSPLAYLESLGAGPRGLPGPLARAIASGLPQPAPFGEPELDAAFPPARWERLQVDDGARIRTIPLRQPGRPESIPGFVAVLRALHPVVEMSPTTA